MEDENKDIVDKNDCKSRVKKKENKDRKHKDDKLSCTEIEDLMRQNSYRRGPGGAIRQKTWGKQ